MLSQPRKIEFDDDEHDKTQTATAAVGELTRPRTAQRRNAILDVERAVSPEPEIPYNQVNFVS